MFTTDTGKDILKRLVGSIFADLSHFQARLDGSLIFMVA
jgi:hypothetical protein